MEVINMWKVGVVGTGFWSDKHIKAWQRIEGVDLVALCNRSPDKLIQKARQFGIAKTNLFNSLERMLDNENIDVVDIVTPPETHLPLVKIAAARGKHIMCQKPFAPTLEEAEEIVRICEQAGVRLMVTENWRWLQPVQIVKRVIAEGILGDIRVARIIHSDYFTTRMTPGKTVAQPFLTTMPNLLFYEMGVHWYDTWRFLFGEPKRMYAELKSFSPYVLGEDSGVITLGYDNFYGLMDMCWVSRREMIGPIIDDQVDAHFTEHFVIDGSNATLKMYGLEGKIVIINNDGKETVVAEKTQLDHEESHFRLQSHFIQCLNTGENFQTNGSDNLKTLRMTFSTYESAKEHKVVQFKN
jgi:predicted dehydrogenase